jgi:septal ring factor EnvC (AmiA/AmiB activator)
MAAALGFALLFASNSPAINSPAMAQSALDALRQRDRELESVRAEQKKAAETRAKLQAEIDAIGEDRRKLNQALIATAARVRAEEARLASRSRGGVRPSRRCWQPCSASGITRRRPS